jgi:acyl-CoA thioesterase-2
MTSPRRRTLASILELRPAGEDQWTAPTPGQGPPRLFGGQVAAQAMAAAVRTVEPSRVPHSLHAYFVRPGRPDTDLELAVERTRDGRSFTTRHVTARQDGKVIFTLTASFHEGEDGLDWQLPPPPMTDGPSEAELSPDEPNLRAFWDSSPFLMRSVAGSDRRLAPHPCWVRLLEPIDPDPAAQACALTFVSDMGVVFSARAPEHRAEPASLASLDHAVWFHRPFDVGDWLLFSVDPVTNAGGRALARGSFHDRHGRLVASIAQEGLVRQITDPGEWHTGAPWPR